MNKYCFYHDDFIFFNDFVDFNKEIEKYQWCFS